LQWSGLVNKYCQEPLLGSRFCISQGVVALRPLTRLTRLKPLQKGNNLNAAREMTDFALVRHR
jgi:hypothetical protein